MKITELGVERFRQDETPGAAGVLNVHVLTRMCVGAGDSSEVDPDGADGSRVRE